jgi:succinyl-diaminopimelate desuccinylase
MTTEHEEILAYIDSQRDAIVALLRDLIRTPSVFPPGEYAAIATRMRDECAASGARVALLNAPQAEVEARGLAWPRPNVVAALDGSGDGPVLLIGTHMDVVDADPAEWSVPPFDGVVRDGRVYGRGACDAKNAMVAQVFAARALAAAGVKMRGTLMLVSSVDDEGRFDRLKWPGMTWLVEEGLAAHGFPMPDMVINGEASGLASICGSFKGRIIMEIPVIGATAHAATEYGVNAIDKGLLLVEVLKQIELKTHPLQGPETLTICAIRGAAERYGDIPPVCHVGVEIRVVPPFGTARMMQAIHDAIAQLSAADPSFAVGEFTIFSSRDPIEFDASGPLIVAIRESAARVGQEAAFAGILGTGELQAFVSRGIPGVTYGGGFIGHVHRPDEYVEIDDLVRQTKIYALTALALCGAPVATSEPVG